MLGIDVDEDGCEKTFMAGATFSPTMQTEEVLLTQKTSRQQAVTPRFGGSFENGEDEGVI
jgi:hypothetical protein